MNERGPALYDLQKISKWVQGPKEILTILRNIGLKVYRGESLAIVGASGSGKTTLLQLLGGLDDPSQGRIFFQGQDVSLLSWEEKAHIRNSKIGYVFQFHHLLPEFSTWENIAMPAIISGRVKKKEIYSKAAEIVQMIGLTGQENQPVSTLSGGERQLAAIGRAIMQNPEVILADEPTGNLDARNEEKVCNLLTHFNQVLKTTVIVVTHNQELAAAMKRRLRLHHGELYEEKDFLQKIQ